MDVSKEKLISLDSSQTLSSTANSMKDNVMWHPHVYRTPPKSPTPFSIDDILGRPSSVASGGSSAESAVTNLSHFTAEEWLRVAYYAMQSHKLQITQNHSSEAESGRDSSESTPTNSNSTTEDEAQPLNLSLTTTKPSCNDPYDHDFILERSQNTGKNFLFFVRGYFEIQKYSNHPVLFCGQIIQSQKFHLWCLPEQKA